MRNLLNFYNDDKLSQAVDAFATSEKKPFFFFLNVASSALLQYNFDVSKCSPIASYLHSLQLC